ncbi:MAG: HEAT repeat domain-containing protein [Anaerolineaceae bacterium]|nr:HEAT repeat domain-containing protein [Anaerolineaceae bacterium]
MNPKRALLQLQNGTTEERGSAMEALAEAGHAAALPTLAALLSDADHSIRYQAAMAIGRILRQKPQGGAERTEELIAALQPALRGEDMWLRMAATAALVSLGEAAVPSLVHALQDDQAAVRRAAAKALGKLGDAAALADLLRALTDVDVSTRRFAAQALGRIGHAAAVAALGDSLRDADRKVREASGVALGKIGRPAAPILIEALSDPDPEIGMHAIFALRAMNYSPQEGEG